MKHYVILKKFEKEAKAARKVVNAKSRTVPPVVWDLFKPQREEEACKAEKRADEVMQLCCIIDALSTLVNSEGKIWQKHHKEPAKKLYWKKYAAVPKELLK